MTPRPNFLVLLGERYGWRPLPDAVPDAEFRALVPHLAPDVIRQIFWQDGRTTADQGWYRLDENAVISLHDGSGFDLGEWRLQPRQGRFENERVWTDEVERPLGKALRQAARAAWSDPGDERRLKFEASATEQEIVAGALKVPDAGEHVCTTFRRILLAGGATMVDDAKASGAARFTRVLDLNPDSESLDMEASGRLADLKKRLQQHLDRDERQGQPQGRIIHYDATWVDGQPSPEHLSHFASDVLAALQAQVDAQMQRHETFAAADDEPLRHWDFARRRSRGFKEIGRAHV